MPEGPEVEVLVRHLDPLLRGRRIRGLRVVAPRMVRPTGSQALEQSLVGARFSGAGRRAKYLCLGWLRPDGVCGTLYAHLGMTGRLYLQDDDAPAPRHAALWLDLDRGRLMFEDARRFGRFHLDPSVLQGVGPDPLGDGFTAEFLGARLRESRQAVKIRLMDPAVAPGVGNIYASESLFRAGVSPGTAAARLSGPQVVRLHGAVRETLAEAVALGTAMELDFAGQGDRDGLFYFGGSGAERPVERFSVYDRAGRPCRVCGEGIRRRVQGGRSTYWCPRCQRG